MHARRRHVAHHLAGRARPRLLRDPGGLPEAPPPASPESRNPREQRIRRTTPAFDPYLSHAPREAMCFSGQRSELPVDLPPPPRWCDREFGSVKSAFSVFDVSGDNQVSHVRAKTGGSPENGVGGHEQTARFGQSLAKSDSFLFDVAMFCAKWLVCLRLRVCSFAAVALIRRLQVRHGRCTMGASPRLNKNT